MGKKLHKSLRIYFSKLKKIRSMSLPRPHTTSSLLSACKYPKTPSFAAAAADRSNNNNRQSSELGPAATLSDVDRFLFENFQSLYIQDDDDDSAEYSHPSPDDIKPSDRFFASPRTSNSIADEARSSSSSSSSSSSASSPAVGNPDSSASSASAAGAAEAAAPPGGESVAVVTFSKEPYEDFRRSMQDMVDARHVDPGQALDWDFMEELLFCYLDLNDRAVHKHILRAFADLAVSFRRRIPRGRSKVPDAATARRRRSDVIFRQLN